MILLTKVYKTCLFSSQIAIECCISTTRLTKSNIFLQNYLHMSQKSSTFAPDFE